MVESYSLEVIAIVNEPLECVALEAHSLECLAIVNPPLECIEAK